MYLLYRAKPRSWHGLQAYVLVNVSGILAFFLELTLQKCNMSIKYYVDSKCQLKISR
jgi:hypothetical protein